jgi:hypothetical protein
VYLTAVVVPEGIFTRDVDCDGNEVNPDGTTKLINGKTVPFHTHGSPLVGCVAVMFP